MYILSATIMLVLMLAFILGSLYSTAWIDRYYSRLMLVSTILIMIGFAIQ